MLLQKSNMLYYSASIVVIWMMQIICQKVRIGGVRYKYVNINMI